MGKQSISAMKNAQLNRCFTNINIFVSGFLQTRYSLPQLRAVPSCVNVN